MTGTSQKIPSPISARPLADTAPVLPLGLKGYLAPNPDFGKNDGLYHTPLYFSTNPADALPSVPVDGDS